MQLLRPVMLVLAGYCIVANALAFGPAANYLNGCGRREELMEVAQWLRTNSPPETLVAATISEPTMHFYKASGCRVVENYLQKKPVFSVAAHSTNGPARASYVLLNWYSNLKPDELNGGLELAKASAQGNYRLYRVTQP